MQNNELVFSGDCVLNLDDFGQFKDYTDTLENFYTSILNDSPKIQLLQEILDADKQDIFHLPKFEEIVVQCIQKQQIIQQCDRNQQKNKTLNQAQNKQESLKLKLLKMYLEILEQSFFSYICKDQTVELIAKRLNQVNTGKDGAKISIQILKFLYKLSQSVNYIGSEDQNKILSIFINLSQSLQTWMNCLDDGSRYILIVDYFLRNRVLRGKIMTHLEEISQPSQKESYQYLWLKIQLWRGNHQKCKQILSFLKQKKYGQYLSQSIDYWSEKII